MEKYLHEEEKFYDLVPKYVKRSSQRKTKKAKHKHIYIDYIGVVPKDEGVRYLPVSTCKICGKVGEMRLWFTKKTEDGFNVVLESLEEIQELNPELEVKKFEKTPW